MGNFLLDPTLALVQVVSAVGLCTGWFVMMNSLYGSGPKAVETLDV
jgi:hypothetical protein